MPQRDLQLRHQRGQPPPPPPPPATPTVMIGTPVSPSYSTGGFSNGVMNGNNTSSSSSSAGPAVNAVVQPSGMGGGGGGFQRQGSHGGPGSAVGLNGTNPGFIPRSIPGGNHYATNGLGNGGVAAPQAIGTSHNPNSGMHGSNLPGFPNNLPSNNNTHRHQYSSGGMGSRTNSTSSELPPPTPFQTVPQQQQISVIVVNPQPKASLKILDRMRIKALVEGMDAETVADLMRSICSAHEDALQITLAYVGLKQSTMRGSTTLNNTTADGPRHEHVASSAASALIKADAGRGSGPSGSDMMPTTKLNPAATGWSPSVPQQTAASAAGGSPLLKSSGPSGQDLFQQYAQTMHTAGGGMMVHQESYDGEFTDDKLIALTNMVVDEYE